MKPYNHVSDLDNNLGRFATFLGSQHIPFKIQSPDYDNPGTIVVKGRYYRYDRAGLYSFKPFDYDSKIRHDGGFPIDF